jgi:hypothetical protein
MILAAVHAAVVTKLYARRHRVVTVSFKICATRVSWRGEDFTVGRDGTMLAVHRRVASAKYGEAGRVGSAGYGKAMR